MRFEGRVRVTKNLRLFKFALVLEGFDRFASLTVNPNRSTGEYRWGTLPVV